MKDGEEKKEGDVSDKGVIKFMTSFIKKIEEQRNSSVDRIQVKIKERLKKIEQMQQADQFSEAIKEMALIDDIFNILGNVIGDDIRKQKDGLVDN